MTNENLSSAALEGLKAFETAQAGLQTLATQLKEQISELQEALERVEAALNGRVSVEAKAVEKPVRTQRTKKTAVTQEPEEKAEDSVKNDSEVEEVLVEELQEKPVKKAASKKIEEEDELELEDEDDIAVPDDIDDIPF